MKAIEASDYFRIGTRTTTNEKFVYLCDKAPQELQNLVFKIHNIFDCGTNDWIYDTIQQAFDELTENELDDIAIESDIYNSDLLKWLYENGNQFAIQCCDSWGQETGVQDADIIKQISGGQYLAMRAIYEAVNDFIDKE